MLIEDVQFAIENVLEGERVAYCDTAILYDEQPVDFVTSWWQRLRWCKGYIQILRKYTGKLLKAFLCGKGFSNYDMIMAMSPAFFISLAATVANIVGLALALIFEPHAFLASLISTLAMCVGAYLLFLIVFSLVVIGERKRIRATVWQMICAVLTFPIYMATYIPIVAAAIFAKNEWRQIKHTRVETNPVSDGDGEKNK